MTRPGRLPAHTSFFPLATLYALVVLPISVLGMTGLWAVPRALAGGWGHAHEMLFGYALAVVAGYLLGPLSRRRLWTLAAVWAAARVAFILLPQSAISAVLNGAFIVVLVAEVAPKYLRAVKRLRNQAFVPILVGIGMTAIAQEIARYVGESGAQRTAQIEAVLLFALLLLFMGGRIIAPAVAGQFYRQGQYLAPRVQPNFEIALILTMTAALALAPFSAGRVPAAVLLAAAGLLAWVRLLRWRLWGAHARTDLWCLGVGYGWIAVGLIGVSLAWIANYPLVTALHALTIGALGTLTLNVMVRVATARARREAARSRIPVAGTMLLAFATLTRVLADFAAAGRTALLLMAAASWTAAFAALFAGLMGWRRGPTTPTAAAP